MGLAAPPRSVRELPPRSKRSQRESPALMGARRGWNGCRITQVKTLPVDSSPALPAGSAGVVLVSRAKFMSWWVFVLIAVLAGVMGSTSPAWAQTALLTPSQRAALFDDAFELELYKDRFEQEVRFRAAAVEVAWGAEEMCDHTTEIEPFVLWSLNAMRKRLGSRQEAIFKRATGMDEKWRVVWMDESVPETLKRGDVVVAINGLPLGASSTKVDLQAVFRGNAVVSVDDEAYWNVIAKARQQAVAGQPITLHLEDGRLVEVATQTGCEGSVTASAFDADPDKFWRQGNRRIKLPANAMLEARTRDEFRWLAAFGTFFQATAKAVGRQQLAESMSSAFTVGRALTFLVPGSGLVLGAAQAQAERALAVDGIIGSADLFANELVVALGGAPEAGLRFVERLREMKLKTDVFEMNEFRMGSMQEHVRRLQALERLAREPREPREPGAGDAAPEGVPPTKAPGGIR